LCGEEEMKQVIHKFAIEGDTTGFELDAMAKPLCVQIDEKDGKPYLWILRYPDEFKMVRTIKIVGTGQDQDGNVSSDKYIGTFQDRGFVWHVFGLYY